MRALRMVFAGLALQMACSVVSVSAQPVQLVGITNSTWRFQSNGVDQLQAWKDVGFDDSSWPTGRALFGNDTGYPYPFVTPIPGPTTSGIWTIYYRIHFTWSGPTAGVILSLTNFVDDGDVLYLNGVEFYRFNMPSTTPVLFDTPATAALTEPIRDVHQVQLDTNSINPLVVGDNVLAVEVHQANLASSDTVFGLSVYGSQSVAPCTDNVQPTNRIATAGQNTTFLVVLPANCGIPAPSIQWYRNVGAGEEVVTGQTGISLTLTNVQSLDAGEYYCRLNNGVGAVVDSRHAVLTVRPDTTPPVFLFASGDPADLTLINLVVDEPLCTDPSTCGSDATFAFVWHVADKDNLSDELGVNNVSINGTNITITTSTQRAAGKVYRIFVDGGSVCDQQGSPSTNCIPGSAFIDLASSSLFQQGVNGYTGTHDTELRQAAADTPQFANLFVTVDNDDPPGTAQIAQGLLRFENVFGSGPDQVPLGANIISARLTLTHGNGPTPDGDPVNLYRMLIPWDESTATYNSLVNGVQADGVEAMMTSDFTINSAGIAVGAKLTFELQTSVQAWANGEANFGWAFIQNLPGGNGYRWDTSESAVPDSQPRLAIVYTVPACTTPPTFTQQPTSVMVNEGGSFTLTAGVNACGASFQWTKDDATITGATGLSYAVMNAVPGAGGSGGSYRLRVTNVNGSRTSDPAVVTVNPDLTRPTVLRVSGGTNLTSVTIVFSKVVSAATAQSTANYTISPSLAVNSAVLSSSGTTVTLTTAARTVGTVYTITISGIKDTRASQNLVNPNPTVLPLVYQTRILAFRDVWKYDQSGTDLGTAWRASNYDDSAWASGPGILGFETTSNTLVFMRSIAPPDGTNTVLTLTNNAGQTNVTFYFRTAFNNPFTDLSRISFTLRAYVDDGAVWFMNGNEVGRYNITNTPTLFNTFANAALTEPNPDPQTTFITTNITGIVSGMNHFAVEVHQDAFASSDIDWGAEILANIGVAEAQAHLTITHNGDGTVTINWTGNGTLQEAAAVTGAWSSSADQSKPQTRAVSGNTRFFRVQVSP